VLYDKLLDNDDKDNFSPLRSEIQLPLWRKHEEKMLCIFFGVLATLWPGSIFVKN
jgi:hypothetical protein